MSIDRHDPVTAEAEKGNSIGDLSPNTREFLQLVAGLSRPVHSLKPRGTPLAFQQRHGLLDIPSPIP